nr:MAG TPA: hypothetical protein [Caudoviricetes sp.]
MELEYVPVQVAMRREIARLSDEETGRALKAILDYMATGEDVEPEGNAAFLYLALLRECDKICKIHEVRSAGGKAGGRGRPKKTKAEEIQQPESEQAQLNPETEQKPEAHTPAPFISDEEAVEIQQGTNEVLDEAQRQGFPDTTATMETLNQLVADNGTEEVLKCVKIAGESGKPNIRYLKGVINGRAKEKQEKERREQARIEAEKHPIRFINSTDEIEVHEPPKIKQRDVFMNSVGYPEVRTKLEEIAKKWSS